MTYPIIGIKYTGPPLDRPCLRRMPAGWYLTPEREESHIVAITLWALALFASLSLIRFVI